MAAAHPFGAFVRYRFKRIGCVCRIKVKLNALLHTSIRVLNTMHVFVSSDGSVDSMPNYILHSNMYSHPLCMF